MYEELLPGFYRIEVPLPGSPLRALNAYLVMGSVRNLLIDNGFNMPECAEALNAALQELGVNLVETDFFLTHLHSDHNGLTSSLARSRTSKIMCSQEDGQRINEAILEDAYWEDMFDALVDNGFPRAELGELHLTHPGRIYASPSPLRINYVEDGDTFSYGRYTFMVLEVPGHTPGHVALYELGSKTLVSGDHILGTITPNITPWSGVEDSLGNYLKSLDKISALDVSRTFPAHRGMIENTGGRIAELKEHHRKRLDETCRVLSANGALSAYGTAAHMTWGLRGITWAEFAVQQKCFATGETLAHLVHLDKLGLVRAVNDNGVTLFRLLKQ